MRILAVTAAASAALSLGGFTASEAFALAPGVHVNPSSPASQQYAFPLGAQRSAGAGVQSAPNAPGPLFGVGVTSAPGGSSKTGSSSSSGGGANTPGTAAGGAASGARGPVRQTGAGPSAASVAGLARLTRPGSSFPLLALIVAGTVFAGLGLGLALAVVRARRGG